MSAPVQQPVARGNLGETPFAHLAIYLYRRTTSGTLVIELVDGGGATIRFVQGRPIGARVSWQATGLQDSLLPLCSLSQGEFSFFDQDLLGSNESVHKGVVDPYALLAASLREHARDDMVEAVLERYRGIKLRLQPGRDLDRLSLAAEDKSLVELIRAAPDTPDELVKQSPLSKQHARRVLYMLVVTHMLSPHEDRNEDTYKSHIEIGSAHPTFTQINEIAAVPMAAWRRLASLRPGGPISSRPNVPISSRPNVSMSPRPNVSMSPQPNVSMSPQSNVSIPSSQPGSNVSIAPRMSGRPAGASAAPQAAVALSTTAPDSDERTARLRRAEQLMQRGRCDEALTLVDGLLLDQPERPDLLALRGHALFDKHGAETDGLPRNVVDALKKALDVDPDQPRALYLRGLVYQRAGETKKAVATFKRVLQVDPKHIEAQREVRLAKLRDEK
jgi:tetratricopeptide (TPR) repeat protein